jgi:hypothetical protein
VERVRNRLVNFRVTDEELQHLKTVSALQNAKCVSDYARSAILHSLERDHQDPLRDRLVAMDRRLLLLETSVAHLLKLLTASKAPIENGS